MSTSEYKRQIAEIRNRADIRDVWAALGGGELRHGRGRAFWREGDGYNVSVDAGKGVWFDFVANVGGDVFALVQVVQGCDFKQALAWLAEFTGVALNGSRESPDVGGIDTAWST